MSDKIEEQVRSEDGQIDELNNRHHQNPVNVQLDHGNRRSTNEDADLVQDPKSIFSD